MPKITLLFLLAFSLLVGATPESLQKLDNARELIASKATSRVWHGYHDFQSLYMQAMLADDRSLQIDALRGLIAASKKLGIDPRRYENALKAVAPKAAARSKSSAEKERVKTAALKPKSVVRPAVSSVKKLTLQEADVQNGALVLRFSDRIEKNRIRRFALKSNAKGHARSVVDIKGCRAPFSIKRIKGEGFVEIRIAQYDPKTVRIVLETEKPYRWNLQTEGEQLALALPGRGKSSEKPSASVVAASDAGKDPLMARYRKILDASIVIDPGHGGKDPGAVGRKKLYEKNAVLAIAKALRVALKQRGFNNVHLTRASDKFISLKQRTNFANKKRADLFVSIHANAAPKKSKYASSYGIETFFLSPARSKRAKRVAALENSQSIEDMNYYSKNTYLNVINREKIIESNKLAIDLQRGILQFLRKQYKNVRDGGVREGPFWVLVGAQMPAVVVEVGYITNKMEGKRLFDPAYQKGLASGMADGISSFLLNNPKP